MDLICRRTGLNPAEIELVIRCFNGIGMPPPAVPETKQGGVLLDRNHLLMIVRGEERNAYEDLEHSGVWLETFTENPEQPYMLSDLVEKLSTLSDAQAECLIYYVAGWWDARGL